ncbi:serine acetyltransferase [Clostridium sp. AWRP]|uniref:serine O-acetyltransferase n=1 Tax=Clostridium sp. AWRP TaxID=2212991 RepID=UPI000FD6E0E9|nr:serine acetyltransferase [Clostridium sp. AWRP]AZV55529.1 serine acetyltransferase [Clostridium sp. AWRP]
MAFKEKIKNVIKNWVKGFNYDKYWNRREKIFDPHTNKILKMYYKLYIYRVNYKNNADINFIEEWGDCFQGGRPTLGHNLNGIVIAAGARIGKNCFLSHQVTIGRSRGGEPVIGDNVYIGPGAKIFGGIHVGNNVRIGANCIVFEDIPDNATVVLEKPRVIIKKSGYKYSLGTLSEENKNNG